MPRTKSELREELEAHIRRNEAAPNWKRVGSTVVGDVHADVYVAEKRWTAYVHEWAGRLVLRMEPLRGS